jgi:hypothetical protein
MKINFKYILFSAVLMTLLGAAPSVLALRWCCNNQPSVCFYTNQADCLSSGCGMLEGCTEQHLGCQNDACVYISGGISVDLCQSNTDCQLAPGHTTTPAPTSTPTTQPNPPAGGTGVSIPNPIGSGTFQDLVERIARYLFQIGIPIAVIMILYAAFLYMTAGGSEEKVNKAHKALTYAVIGLGILFLAWGITSLVKELLGGQ